MFQHHLNYQTDRINKRTDALTKVVKAQGGVVNKMSGTVSKLESNVTEMQNEMKEMQKNQKDLESRLQDMSNQVVQSKLAKEIADSKLQIIFFKVPYDHKNHHATAKKIKDTIDGCQGNPSINDEVKLTTTKTVTLPGQLKTDPFRIVIATCISENVRKGLFQQLKGKNVLDKGISAAEVFPRKYRNKARDLTKVGNFIRGISNNKVKFKVFIDGFELQLRLKFSENGDFVIQKGWTPPSDDSTSKACTDYGAPNPPHASNKDLNGTPLAESVLKTYAMSVQINSKVEITDDLFTKYKDDIKSAWTGKPQIVENVLPGGEKSLYVTFDTMAHAGEAFTIMNDQKPKYWPEMNSVYMVNFNI